MININELYDKGGTSLTCIELGVVSCYFFMGCQDECRNCLHEWSQIVVDGILLHKLELAGKQMLSSQSPVGMIILTKRNS